MFTIQIKKKFMATFERKLIWNLKFSEVVSAGVAIIDTAKQKCYIGFRIGSYNLNPTNLKLDRTWIGKTWSQETYVEDGHRIMN
jgi:hypothetical protein